MNKRLVALAALCAVAAILGVSRWSGPESLRDALLACRGSEECVREVLRARSNADPISTIETVEDLHRSVTGLRPDCHRTLHIYGQEKSGEVLRGDLLELESRWEACGAGVLHGVYETLRVPAEASAAARAAFPLCRSADFASDPDLLRGCYHSLGHSFYDSRAEADRPGRTASAELACAAALPLGFDAQAVAACLNGAYMRDRDARLTEDGSITVRATWDETLPQCRSALDPLVCAILYYEPLMLAATDPEKVALDFHSWCVSLDERGLVRCSEFFGSTVDILAGPDRTDPGLLCVTTEDVDPLSCLAGLRANMTTVGRTREEIDARICPLAARALLDCEKTAEVP